ncbi:response regulator transcription factor [Nonomuraea antimicrobica]
MAELAAGGRTNKEIAQALFVSTKTVEKHLVAVMRKLQARSRRSSSTCWGARRPRTASPPDVTGQGRWMRERE